jgi:ureidoglycolate dehydrogenase (NAD+)
MTAEPTLIAADTLRRYVADVLQTQDVSVEDAAVVADCLVHANLSGVDSHGVVRLPHYVRRLRNGTIQARPTIMFEQRAPAMGVLDGGDGLGHVVTWRACREAAALARSAGVGMVSVRHSSHFGMTGYYAYHLAKQGLASQVMTDTDAFLIPFGGRQAFFGTNPICMGWPTPREIPVILDMATTSVPYGKVALAQAEGRAIPPDWGLDAAGNPTTDPHAVAGLHPIAGPKGSGLAMMIGMYSSLLAGAPWGPHINAMYGQMDAPRGLAHFVMAFDVARLTPLDEFQAELGRMLDELTAVPPAAGYDRVYYPGEIEGLRRAQRARDGVPIEAGLWAELAELGEEVGVEL